jgi:hypothetical protein
MLNLGLWNEECRKNWDFWRDHRRGKTTMAPIPRTKLWIDIQQSPVSFP